MGFSNDFMVAAPQHPFLAQMLAALPTWNRRFGTKYPTVMFSTGPMFVSYQVPRIFSSILPACVPTQHPDALLLCHYGSPSDRPTFTTHSGHNADAPVPDAPLLHSVAL